MSLPVTYPKECPVFYCEPKPGNGMFDPWGDRIVEAVGFLMANHGLEVRWPEYDGNNPCRFVYLPDGDIKPLTPAARAMLAIARGAK